MPTLTRWFIKSSLVYFVAALVIAVLLALQAPLNLPSAIGSLMPVYFQCDGRHQPARFHKTTE
jgi:hypothetical protein